MPRPAASDTGNAFQKPFGRGLALLQTQGIAGLTAGRKAKLNNFDLTGLMMASRLTVTDARRALGIIPVAAIVVFGFALSIAAEARAQTPEGQPRQVKEHVKPQTKKEAPPLKGETPATVLDGGNVRNVLGMQVRDAAGHNMGRIIDLLVDRNGEVRAAIIDFGGFLGVGTRKVAVDWHALHFPAKGPLDNAILDLSRDAVTKAPEYKAGEPIVVLQSTRTPAPRAPTVAPKKAKPVAKTPPAVPTPAAKTPAAQTSSGKTSTPASQTHDPNTATPKAPAPQPRGQAE
jgi:hypothetical protein